MKRFLRSVCGFLVLLGIDPQKMINTLRGVPLYLHDLRLLRNQQKISNLPFRFGKPCPCIGDRFLERGVARGHYFHQDLWVARRVFMNKPQLHVDVGSRVDGFVAHVASFRQIEIFDIRPLTTKIPNIKFKCADLMGVIDASLIDYCDSLSCLHALEHFGLGRYGDTIKISGYLNGLNNLYRILKKGGKFYASVPIGPQRIEFNGHRAFSVKYLLELFDGKYNLDYFSYVDGLCQKQYERNMKVWR